MNARLFYTANHTASEPIEELSRVRLLRSKDVPPAGRLPEGASGTIVSVYGDGEAYCVEFTDPFHAILTLENSEMEAVPEASRDSAIAASRELAGRNS